MAKKKNTPRTDNRAKPLGLAQQFALCFDDDEGKKLLEKEQANAKAEEQSANRPADRNPLPHNQSNLPPAEKRKSYQPYWHSDENQQFINPYNFISFDAKKPPRRKTPENGALTGWIDCTLTTKTPLIIPDTANAKSTPCASGGEHMTMPFFTLQAETDTKRPAIPGSTLRGAIRALYESASGSCLPIDSSDDITLSTRLDVDGSAKTRALLHYDIAENTWSLHAVQRDTLAFNSRSNEYAQGFRFPDKAVHLNHDGTLSLNGYAPSFTAGQELHFVTNPAEREVKKLGKIEYEPCTEAIPVDKGGQTGYVQFVAPLPGKDFSPRVLALDSGKLLHTWAQGDDTPAKELATVLDFYTQNAGATTGKNTNATPYKALAAALHTVRQNGGYVPVWVLKIKRASGEFEYYLTCSSVGRIIMRNDWARLLGKFQSCDNMNRLCPACRLFGNAHKKASGDSEIETDATSYAGHVRFSDALQRTECKVKCLPPRTLPELAGPKPTATVFYTHRPSADARSWNYDYYTVKGSNNNDQQVAISNPEELLLGRKGYWHHTPSEQPNRAQNTSFATNANVSNGARATQAANGAQYGDEPKTQRNCTMEPMNVGAQFTFKLYFEQISQQQLDELIWVCTLGENRADSNRQQKIGHAKPLGYGSVKITVNAVHTRTLHAQDETLSYQIVKDDYTQKAHRTIACPFDEASQTMQELLALCDATRAQGDTTTNVCYPLGSAGDKGKANDNASHQWFAGNKVFYEKGYVLPAATDEVLYLPRIYKK